MSDVEPSGAITPSESVVAELKGLLQEDESRLGEVHRLSNEGKSPEEISEELGIPTQGFVYTYLSMRRALLEGEIASGPTVARQNAGKIRTILKRVQLSDDARTTLEHNLKLLEANSRDDSALAQESIRAKEGSRPLEELLESQQLAGIYVYSFGTYMAHPKRELTNQVLYKVGRSTDVRSRVYGQAKTAMPEDPIILRVYVPVSTASTLDSDVEKRLRKVEKNFHDWLLTACHDWNEGGSEWFLTTLEFLDKVASALDLKAYINEKIS